MDRQRWTKPKHSRRRLGAPDLIQSTPNETEERKAQPVFELVLGDAFEACHPEGRLVYHRSAAAQS